MNAVSGVTEELFRALYDGIDGVLELRAFDLSGALTGRTFSPLPAKSQVGAFLDSNLSHNVFFGVATRQDASSGKAENLALLSTLFVDIDFKDTPETDARKRLAEFPLQPSAIIQSGGGLHVYYFLVEPIDLCTSESLHHIRALLRRLAAFLGGDLKAAEPSRMLRHPDSLNFKYNPPRPCVVESLESARRYNPSEFDEFLPSEPQQTNGHLFTAPEKIAEGCRNDTLFRLGRSLRAKELSRRAIAAALQAENTEKCVPPLGQDEVERICDSVWTSPDSSAFQRNGKPSGPTMSGTSGSEPESWPEIQPVKDSLLPVLPLHLDIVPAPLKEWIGDVANRMQVPPDFMANAALTMVGSVVGAGVGIRPKRHDDWTVVPNLWGAGVGRPSMLKTPAISEAMKPLDGLEQKAKSAYEDAKKRWGAEHEVFEARKESIRSSMKKAASGKLSAGSDMESLKYDFSHLEEPAKPTWRRYKTNDSTIEKMCELQAENPRGILLLRDELIGLFRTWDKDGHESDRAFYLEAWNGDRPYTSDRIGRGTTYVDNLCVSIFGGIQPAILTSYLHQTLRGGCNDGLTQRLQLAVYPDEPASWTLIDAPVNKRAREAAYQAIERLATLDFRQHGALGDEGRLPYYRFTADAQAVFNEWLTELEGKLRNHDDEPVLLEHLGKYRSLMPSLALLFHVLGIANDKPAGQVTKEDAERAAAWCEYLESHARRIYGLATNLTAQAASRLAVKIQKDLLPSAFTARDVYRKEWALLDDRQVIENACDELVALGWLKTRRTPSSFGQKGKVEYLINPKTRQS